MAYGDVPVKWLIVAAFFASTYVISGITREAVFRLDRS